MKAQHTVSLTPDTVTRVSTGEVTRPRRPPAQPRRPPALDEQFKAVPPAALKGALKAAGGDRSLLWLDPDDNSVWVLNHPRGDTCLSAACPACSRKGKEPGHHAQFR